MPDNTQRADIDRVIVRFTFDSWSQAVETLQNTSIISATTLPNVPNTVVAHYPDSTTADHALEWLSGEPGVLWAEPDYVAQYSFEPDDPLFDDQIWAQSIDLPAAWNITAGADTTIIAVVDSGVSQTHPDLDGKLLQGRDFLNGDDIPEDDLGHGTAVAGILAASGDNGVGIAGVAMDAMILPVKVGGVNGAPISTLSSGIIWAVDQGADVINLSLVADLPSSTLEDAVRYAYDHNVPVIAAAGNDPDAVTYPGKYQESISIGASTIWGSLASFTSRENRIDLVAPGTSIVAPWWSKTSGDGWTTVSGTSFATPMVAGVVALLLTLDPDLSVEDIRSILTDSATPLGNDLPPPGSGAGQLDAGASLRSVLVKNFDATWSPVDSPVAAGVVDRTWIWGPGPKQTGFEAYDEAPRGERLVQYYDKSRMEINEPLADSASVWYVTNGLLVKEMITGQMQLGDNRFEFRGPAQVVVAGDPLDPLAPTYADFLPLLSRPAGVSGAAITAAIDSFGNATDEPSFASYGVTNVWYVAETNHQIASVFWDYLNTQGLVQNGNGLAYDLLFNPTFFATGLPITEAYWTRVKVSGVRTDVLVQCFERRCLTYTPSNASEWQVEMGNVGQHYYRWRYPEAVSGTDSEARFQDIIQRSSRNIDLRHHRVRGLYSQ